MVGSGTARKVHVVAHLRDQGTIRLWVDSSGGHLPAFLCVVDDDGNEVARRASTMLEAITDNAGQDPPGAFLGIRYWDLNDLAPATLYRVQDDTGTMLAAFRTLPEQLPLTIVVGSCYSVDDDPPEDGGDAGGVARRYEALDRELARWGRPVDVKVLLGDQVYVDQPWQDYVVPLNAELSWARVACRYALTWQRLGPLLSCGANICLSEDHEYWNNYPYRAAWQRLWSDAKLAALECAARRHRAVYQQTPQAGSFRVGSGPSVQFFVADTRCRRTRVVRDGRFMDQEDFELLIDWIRTLDGPGVLVLGQPLLAAKRLRWIDTTLANYPRQHAPLCRVISEAEHDVVILCGDVHYGRYTVVPLASGRRLVEVVSSPMALLASAGSKPVAAVAPEDLAVDGDFRSEFLQHTRPNGVGEDHVTVLTFSATDDGVSLEATPYDTRFSDDHGVPARGACWGPVVLR